MKVRCNLNLLELSTKYTTDKETTHNYISNFYENAFADYREKPITLIEIGVQGGGSIKLWRDYFDKAKLIGIDTDPQPQNLSETNNFTFIHGDAYSREICNQIPDADIIIDDGPHGYICQIRFLILYLPKLNKDGILVIEDIQQKHLPPSVTHDDSILVAFDDIVELVSDNLGRKYEINKFFPPGEDPSPYRDSIIYCVRRIS